MLAWMLLDLVKMAVLMVMADYGLGLLWLIKMMRTRCQTALYASSSRLRPITSANGATCHRGSNHVAIERNSTVHLLQKVSVLLLSAVRWSLLRLRPHPNHLLLLLRSL